VLQPTTAGSQLHHIGLRLTVEESGRVVWLTRIQALTEDVFGDAQKANQWLRENPAILDGKPPLEIA
jgi:uncharacterized protein (DUF2384 family)